MFAIPGGHHSHRVCKTLIKISVPAQASSLPNIKLRHGSLASFFAVYKANIVCLQVCALDQNHCKHTRDHWSCVGSTHPILSSQCVSFSVHMSQHHTCCNRRLVTSWTLLSVQVSPCEFPRGLWDVLIAPKVAYFLKHTQLN